MGQINAKEKGAILRFLENNYSIAPLENPAKALGQLLLDSFGRSLSWGRSQAKELLKTLSSEGVVEISCDKKGAIVSVKFIKAALAPANGNGSASAKSPLATTQKKTNNAPKKRRTLPTWATRPNRPRREEKSEPYSVEEKKLLAGFASEDRAEKIIVKVVCALQQFPKFIKSATYVRSERKSDDDRSGQDFKISIVAFDDLDDLVGGDLIYDVKSSEADAADFNEWIRFHPNQNDALLKKALVVNKRRHRAEIATEIVDDLVATGLAPDFIRSDILRMLF